jgi:Fur family transcriptional regulator, peroxide stress response regulator
MVLEPKRSGALVLRLIVGLALLGWPRVGAARGTWSVIPLPQQPGEVLQSTAGAQNHPSAEDLFARVRETCPTTSLATVYKTLDTLKEIGEVLELEFRDGSNRYDGVRPQSHPHLVCTRCGKIEDVDLDGISALAAEVAASTGYEIRSHRVDFYGLCADCRVPA